MLFLPPWWRENVVVRLPLMSFATRILLLGLFAHLPLLRAQFVPGPNPITGTVGAQTLSSGVGTVNVGGAISVASGGGVALTMTGTSTLINNGTIQTLGSGRAIDSNSGVSNLTLTNNGLISSESTDAFRINTNSIVSLTNSGTIRVVNGGQAIDWAAITSQSNVLTNLAGGLISAVGEDAVRPGNGGSVNNAGTIIATPTGGASPSGSDGIDLRTEKTVTVTNTGTIQGRHGIATDGANVGPSSLTVNNNAGLIAAVNGSGINIDGVSTSVTATVTNAFGATIQGGVLAAATAGDGDGIDVDGVLTLTNSGNVLGLGAKGAGNNAEAIAMGGGSVTNTATGRIVGSTRAADAPNGDVSKAGNGILVDDSNGGSAIAATTISNAGLIQGTTGFAIKLIGTFNDSVTNEAGGLIQGGKTAAELMHPAVVDTGAGNDLVTNRGAIVSDGGFVARGVTLGQGDDHFRLLGANASVVGTIDGGAGGEVAGDRLTVDVGGGNTARVGGFSNFEQVELLSGSLRVFGDSTLFGSLNLFADPASGSAALIFDASTAGTLHVGAGSSLTLDLSSILFPGDEFVLINLENDAAVIDGFFAGLGEGATLNVGGMNYLVSYTGGTGNDFSIRSLRTVPDAGSSLLGLAVTLGMLAALRRAFRTNADRV